MVSQVILFNDTSQWTFHIRKEIFKSENTSIHHPEPPFKWIESLCPPKTRIIVCSIPREHNIFSSIKYFWTLAINIYPENASISSPLSPSWVKTAKDIHPSIFHQKDSNYTHHYQQPQQRSRNSSLLLTDLTQIPMNNINILPISNYSSSNHHESERLRDTDLLCQLQVIGTNFRSKFSHKISGQKCIPFEAPWCTDYNTHQSIWMYHANLAFKVTYRSLMSGLDNDVEYTISQINTNSVGPLTKYILAGPSWLPPNSEFTNLTLPLQTALSLPNSTKSTNSQRPYLVYDILLENQRASFVGVLKQKNIFHEKALMPTDPSAWCDLSGHRQPGRMT